LKKELQEDTKICQLNELMIAISLLPFFFGSFFVAVSCKRIKQEIKIDKRTNLTASLAASDRLGKH